MNKTTRILIMSLLTISLFAVLPVFAGGKTETSDQIGELEAGPSNTMKPKPAAAPRGWTGESGATAVFAGGCFWGVEAVFERLQGVNDVVSGYSGGDAETAKYQTVGTGTTGHAEAVYIDFNPDEISYETLLEVFFTVAHDPTQLGYQGPDVGSEYRSVIFYTDDAQRTAIERSIEKIEQSGLYKDEVVTEIVPLDAFYPAEDYHQDFIKHNPNVPYVVYWDLPKLKHLEEAYPELITAAE